MQTLPSPFFFLSSSYSGHSAILNPPSYFSHFLMLFDSCCSQFHDLFFSQVFEFHLFTPVLSTSNVYYILLLSISVLATSRIMPVCAYMYVRRCDDVRMFVCYLQPVLRLRSFLYVLSSTSYGTLIILSIPQATFSLQQRVNYGWVGVTSQPPAFVPSTAHCHVIC